MFHDLLSVSKCTFAITEILCLHIVLIVSTDESSSEGHDFISICILCSFFIYCTKIESVYKLY